MHTWHWRTWNHLPYLTCSLLEPWAHGFFTQQFWSRPPSELTTVLHPVAKSYRVKQVHGDMVLVPSSISEMAADPSDEPPPADGLVTEQAEQAVWVCSADCTPALVADEVTGQVAAVHAGWRGTALKILPGAIARLKNQGGHIKNMRVALGPAIAGEVYQVSEQVAAQVGATIVPGSPAEIREPEAIQEILHVLHQLPNSPLLEDPEPGRVKLDVRQVNALQLEQMGFTPDQIAISPHCTYRDAENFFSYRRTRQKKAQWSGIVSN
jgi:YfiH family protein